MSDPADDEPGSFPFDPHWVVHPRETVSEFALAVTGKGFDHGLEDPQLLVAAADDLVSIAEWLVMNEPPPIDDAFAERLSRLGPPKQFWLNLQANYDDGIAKGYGPV